MQKNRKLWCSYTLIQSYTRYKKWKWTPTHVGQSGGANRLTTENPNTGKLSFNSNNWYMSRPYTGNNIRIITHSPQRKHKALIRLHWRLLIRNSRDKRMIHSSQRDTNHAPSLNVNDSSNSQIRIYNRSTL